MPNPIINRRVVMAGRGSVVPLAPNQISGLQVWFKSSSLVLSNNDPVGTWADSSGNSRDASQATGGAKFLYKTNVLGSTPGVRSDGSDDYMTFGTAAMSSGDNVTVVLVCHNIGNLGSRGGVFSTRTLSTAGSWAFEVGAGNGGNGRIAVTTPAVFNAETASATLAGSTPYILAFTRQGSPQAQAIYKNGVAVSLITNSPVAFVDNADTKVIGALTSGGGSPAALDFIDLSVFNRALSASELASLFLSLNTTYAVY